MVDSLFDDDEDTGLNNSGQVYNDEMNSYINAVFNKIPENLEIFWKNNSDKFPKLGRLAKRILNLAPSTAESERSFSRLRLLLTENRQNLSETSISALFNANFRNKKVVL